MKRIYNQPAIQVAQFETMPLMEVSSEPAGPVTLSITGQGTTTQW
jgi:hypothetical protein